MDVHDAVVALLRGVDRLHNAVATLERRLTMLEQSSSPDVATTNAQWSVPPPSYGILGEGRISNKKFPPRPKMSAAARAAMHVLEVRPRTITLPYKKRPRTY